MLTPNNRIGRSKRGNQRKNKTKRKTSQQYTTLHPLLKVCQTTLWTPEAPTGQTLQWAHVCARGLDAALTYLQNKEPLTLRSQSQVLTENLQGALYSPQTDLLFPVHRFSIDQTTHTPIVVVHMHVPQEIDQQTTRQLPSQSTFSSSELAPLLDPLSPREMDVLHCLAQGLSNQEIANQLVIAESTVKWHLKQIYGKLGVNSRTQAIARAFKSVP